MNHISTTDYLDRLTAVRRLLPQWGIDALLITQPENRRWLSGFTGSAGRLLIARENAWLATDFRYFNQSRAEAPHFTLFEDDRTPDALDRWLRTADVHEVGLEQEHVTLQRFAELQQVSGINWHRLDAPLAVLRAVKSVAEIALIAHAAAITDNAAAELPALLRPGVSERAVAWALEQRLRELGADALAFEIIVAAGPNAALPHHRPTDRLLQSGEPIVVDFGAAVAGYRSDLTRTFVIGEPDARFLAIYDIVQQAQRAAIDGLKPDVTGREGDTIARDIIATAGYGPNFGHGLGHGVGLEIHEKPSLSQRAAAELLAVGMVVTVEPGIYIPEWGGIRLEDLVVITSEGARSLSSAPHSPLIG